MNMMSAKGKSIEISGDSVEEAIQKGLLVLGVSRDQIEYEIVDEGRSGFLGIGNKLANIRIWVKGKGASAADQSTAEENGVEPPVTTLPAEPLPAAPAEEAEFDDLEDLPDPYLLEEEEVAVDILHTLMEKMGIEVEIESKLSEADDLGKQAVVINVKGEGLEPLVSGRGENMVDLQYLTRLMVGQKLQRRVTFLVDVNGFRNRKEEGLEKLAMRMAEKVNRRQKPITLEPMNSYERRLIHMSLRDRDDVYTKSVGEGSSRRVRIHPSK